jgi:hypothetical protein
MAIYWNYLPKKDNIEVLSEKSRFWRGDFAEILLS